MEDYGLAGPRLTDGNCIADLLVRAPAAQVASALGSPLQVMRGDDLLIDEQPDDIVAFAAAPSGSGWSAVECRAAAGFTMPGDHLEPLFAQGESALAGRIPRSEPELMYQNPLGVGSRCARALGVDAIALWGSDEWPGAAGGAVLNASGEIVAAYSAYSIDEIDTCRRTRDNFMERLRDDSIDKLDGPTAGDPERWNVSWRWTPDEGLNRVEGGTLALLDQALKKREATQVEDPLDDYGEWYDFDEVWASIAADA